MTSESPSFKQKKKQVAAELKKKLDMYMAARLLRLQKPANGKYYRFEVHPGIYCCILGNDELHAAERASDLAGGKPVIHRGPVLQPAAA